MRDKDIVIDYSVAFAGIRPGGKVVKNRLIGRTEILYVIDGEIEISSPGAAPIRVPAGSTGYIPPGCIKEYRNRSDVNAQILSLVDPAWRPGEPHCWTERPGGVSLSIISGTDNATRSRWCNGTPLTTHRPRSGDIRSARHGSPGRGGPVRILVCGSCGGEDALPREPLSARGVPRTGVVSRVFPGGFTWISVYRMGTWRIRHCSGHRRAHREPGSRRRVSWPIERPQGLNPMFRSVWALSTISPSVMRLSGGTGNRAAIQEKVMDGTADQ